MRVETATARRRRRHRLHRLQRPQLPELRAPARRPRGRHQAGDDELLGVSDGRGDFEYNGTSPNGLFAKRAHLVTPVVSPHDRRPRALQPRGARAARPRTSDPSLRDWLERPALLDAVHRAADRAPGLGRVVGRPARRCGASPRASWPSSSTTTACSASATARAGARSAAARSATSRPLVAPVARPPAPATPVAEIRRGADHVEVDAARRRARALRRGGARRPLRPGAGDARRPDRPRARDPRRDPLPAQRGGAAHRPRLLPRRRRAWASWNYHLLDAPAGRADA